MNAHRLSLAGALLVLASQWPLATLAEVPAAVRHTPTPAGASAATPAAAAAAPTEWIRYDDISVTPVVDDVSRALAKARTALAAHEPTKAADALHAAASALQAQAARAAQGDRRQAAADAQAARDVQARMAALAGQLDDTAAQVRAGRLGSTAELDRTLGKAQRADLERRWMLTDTETWYPLSAEPQRHFTAALADFTRRQYRDAAEQVRQAAAYMRLEAARAHGDAKKALDSAEARLDSTAAALDRGAVHGDRELTTAFARANHALALAHRARAAASWTRQAYDQTGYELKAAAQDLENAAAWSGTQAHAAASAAAADARAAGDKLARGAHWTRDEVEKGFDALRGGLARLDPLDHDKAGPSSAATPG